MTDKMTYGAEMEESKPMEMCIRDRHDRCSLRSIPETGRL